MRIPIAYFAGAGTVIVAIAAGLGGGLVISNVMNPHDAPVSKVERRAVADRQAEPSQQAQPSASPVTASTTAQAPSPYLAQVQPAANAPVKVSPAPAPSNSPQAEV